MPFTKRGLSPIDILGEILIVLAVIVILLAVVIVPRFFQQSEVVGEQIGGIQRDADKDSLRNFFDKCPCTFGDVIYGGCPATFTEEQKQEDVKKYNSEPACGIVAVEGTVEVGPITVERAEGVITTEKKQEPVAFKHYRSIEIFGGDDRGANPESRAIKQACTSWVGKDCPSEDNDCDGNFDFQSIEEEGCWIMMSEDDDTDPNDCGQSMISDGAIISLNSYVNFIDFDGNVLHNYQSKANEDEPMNLLYWKWRSTPDYGSLICSKGFWYGCKEANEGRTLDIAGKTHKCTESEWVKE